MRVDPLQLMPVMRRQIRLAVVTVMASIIAFPPASAQAMTSPFFSTSQARHGDLSPFTKWTKLMPRYNAQRAQVTCDSDDCMPKQWEALLVALKGKPVHTQLEAVNNFFNAVTYVEDSANYGQDDYWATPYEFMERGGDCEDYAIAKYISLKRLGVSTASMRIIILQDNNLGGIMHAVLEVKAGGVNYLLDNQAKDLVDESTIYHYRPIYAINGSAWWTYQ